MPTGGKCHGVPSNKLLEIFDQREQVQRVGWRFKEVEILIKASGFVVLGMDGHCTNNVAHGVGSRS